MIAFIKKLWRDKRGNALVIVAAAMPLVLGSAGLASDTIQWTSDLGRTLRPRSIAT